MIDLQIHTNATPHHATWAPETLVMAAKHAGLNTIAVTDHNTLANVAATQRAGAAHGLHIVPGVEIDSGFNGKLWHTLVYGGAPDDPALLALCATVFERNLTDAERLRAELPQRGFQLDGLDTLGRPPNVADVGAALARSNALPDREPGEDDESAGMRYILTQMERGYRPVGVDEVIAAAHSANAVAVLAHPGRSKGIYAIPATADDVAAMVAAKLDGIEVYYPAHSMEQQRLYRDLAQQHGLLITGGSDSHGPQHAFARIAPEQLRLAPGVPTILDMF